MPNPANGLELIKPSSVLASGTGSSATINTNGSVSFSTCTSLSLNNVFSANYYNYMVVCRTTAVNSSSGWTILLRLRAGGVDNAASSYTWQSLSVFNTIIGAGRLTQTSGRVSSLTNGKNEGFISYFYGPFLNQETAVRSITSLGDVDSQLIDLVNIHSVVASYDGFSLTTTNGTFSGLIGVYGMRK